MILKYPMITKKTLIPKTILELLKKFWSQPLQQVWVTFNFYFWFSQRVSSMNSPIRKFFSSYRFHILHQIHWENTPKTYVFFSILHCNTPLLWVTLSRSIACGGRSHSVDVNSFYFFFGTIFFQFNPERPLCLEDWFYDSHHPSYSFRWNIVAEIMYHSYRYLYHQHLTLVFQQNHFDHVLFFKGQWIVNLSFFRSGSFWSTNAVCHTNRLQIYRIKQQTKIPFTVISRTILSDIALFWLAQCWFMQR